MNKSKNNPLKSKTYKTFDESILGRYIFPSPISEHIVEIMRRYSNIFKKI